MTLPSGWAETTFADIATQRSGNSKLIKGKLIQEFGRDLFPAFSASGQDVWHDDFDDEGDAIIVSAVGARCGKAFRASGRWSAIANTHVVRPESDVVDVDYLFRILNNESFWEKGGTAQPFVKVAATFGRSLPLPPLAEQSRIVAKLDALMTRLARTRAELDRVPVLANKLRRTCLDDAFSDESMATWKSVSLEQAVADGLIGLVRSKAEQGTSGAPYLRMGHYDLDGRFNENDLTAVECSPAELRRFELHPGDVLFNTRNSVELVGKVALWAEGRPGWVFNNNILRLRFKSSILPKFAFRYMMSPRFRSLMAQKTSATTSVAAIYQRALYAASFPVPSLERQHEIVSRIDSTFARGDRLEAEAARARALIDRLESEILARAIRGELVPQDPNDEPASVLLERVRAQRAAAPKPKRGRRAKAEA